MTPELQTFENVVIGACVVMSVVLLVGVVALWLAIRAIAKKKI